MWFLLAVLVVAAYVIRALQPKQPEPQARDVETPVADEGRRIRKIYGTVWIKDPMIVAFDRVGRDRIRKKGGKK